MAEAADVDAAKETTSESMKETVDSKSGGISSEGVTPTAAAPADEGASTPSAEPAAFTFNFSLTPSTKTAGTLVPVVPMIASGTTPTATIPAGKAGSSSRKISRKQQVDDVEVGVDEEQTGEGDLDAGVAAAASRGTAPGFTLSEGFDLSKFKLEIQPECGNQ